MSRRHLSEAHQARAQSHWFGMSRRLLHQRRGSASLQLPLGNPEMPLEYEGPVSRPAQDVCHHPLNQIINGGNQHGSWKKCGLCLKQILFRKWGPNNPRPAQKSSKKNQNVTQEMYVSTGPAAVIRHAAPAMSSEEHITTRDVQAIVEQQTSQQAQNVASMMSQTMLPVMEAMQQLTVDHQQLQQMVQTQQHVLNHVITGQGAQMPYQQGNSMPAVLVPSEDEELMGEPANGRWEADRR